MAASCHVIPGSQRRAHRGAIELPQQSFQALRRRVRQVLQADGVADDLNAAVTALLA